MDELTYGIAMPPPMIMPKPTIMHKIPVNKTIFISATKSPSKRTCKKEPLKIKVGLCFKVLLT
jgi:hypothetical protein